MSAMTLAIGDQAPDFTLRDQHGQEITLSAYAEGKAALIVFFPFAFSGVCSGELTSLRDRLGEFETEHSTLLTLSCDPMYTQRAAADRDGIFFPLLSDFWPHGVTAKDYGVFDEISGGPKRSSYAVDREGIVRWSVHNARGEARDLDAHAKALADLV
jgi:peroxiredoxin